MAKKKKAVTRHDMEHYQRWCGIIYRCASEKARATVEYVWSNLNKDGLHNFSKWVKKQLKRYPEFRGIEYKITRIDNKGNYGPSNCKLATFIQVLQNRITGVLDYDTVVKMRQYKRANIDATLSEMQLIFGHSAANISRCLRGASWANVNVNEPPILSYRERLAIGKLVS